MCVLAREMQNHRLNVSIIIIILRSECSARRVGWWCSGCRLDCGFGVARRRPKMIISSLLKRADRLGLFIQRTAAVGRVADSSVALDFSNCGFCWSFFVRTCRLAKRIKSSNVLSENKTIRVNSNVHEFVDDDFYKLMKYIRKANFSNFSNRTSCLESYRDQKTHQETRRVRPKVEIER